MNEPAAILHAEDDRNDAFFMQLAFHEAGLGNPLFQVADGRAVVDYLEGKAAYADRARYPFPGLVLLDLKMPQMNGFQVLEWRCRRPDFARLPFIVLSASDECDDLDRARELGATDYRIKPLAFTDLIELVREVCDRWLGFQAVFLHSDQSQRA